MCWPVSEAGPSPGSGFARRSCPTRPYLFDFDAVPTTWKVAMAILIVCLVASIVIGAVRLATL
jgi:hypothetical protein